MAKEVIWGGSALHVVGDKYAEFANKHNNVITRSHFEDILEGRKHQAVDVKQFVFGQGIPFRDRRLLATRFSERGLDKNASLNVGMLNPELASHRTTHKVHERNILITEPVVQVEDGAYESDLIVDEACAELDDHVTGQHISAAVLSEAARQMCNAVLHGSLMTPEVADRSYFLIDKLTVVFSCYVLPMPARFRCIVLESSSNARSMSSRFTIRVECIQKGIAAATFSASVAVFEKNFISSVESQVARRVCGLEESEALI